MGGLALSYWRHPRFTKDIDVLVALGGVDVAALVDHLATAGFRAKRGDPLVRLSNAEFVQLLYEPPDAYLDVQVDLLLVLNDYQRQALERRVPISANEVGFEFHVLACEDLILHKLLAARIVDLMDAAALLRANRSTIDFVYLHHWLKEKGLSSDFARVWQEAFPGEPPP
jgi:hypothetical protein